MAQTDMTISSSSSVPFTAQELCEILEYERIVQFCDSVLAGSHPRVKIPVQPSKPLTLSKSSTPNETASSVNPKTSPKLSISTQNSNSGETMSFNRAPNSQRNTGSRIFIPSTSKINPVLLEKSDDLIKAEIKLQRQRLERALKDQVEHQRVSTKTLLRTSESLPNFDVTEVLSKAQAIVQPIPTEDEPPAGAHSSGSDSFDDNTFYSSQHDTPDPSSFSEDQKVLFMRNNEVFSCDKQYPKNSPKALYGVTPPDSSQLDKVSIPAQDSAPNSTLKSYSIAKKKQLEVGPSGSNKVEEIQRHGKIPKINKQHLSEHNRALTNTENSRFIDSFADTTCLNKPSSTQDDPNEFKDTTRCNGNSPLVVSQSTHASPSNNSRGAILPRLLATDEAQPAQISALRHEHRISSTDSSPFGKVNGRKELKMKQNTRDDSLPNSPYIKPEPQSSSPFQPLARPQKKQCAPYAPEVSYDEQEVRTENSAQERLTDSHREAWRPHEQERQYASLDYQPLPRRFDGDYSSRRFSNEDYARRPQSPEHTNSCRMGETRSRAPSVVMGRRPFEDNRFYKEPIARASVYPETDRNRSRSPLRENVLMGPPRQPVRVIIDEHGRQHYDYSPTSMRHSVAPMIRYRDDEFMYERLPSRTVSGRLPMRVYDEGDISSRRGSPTIIVPRRTVTQPEYLPAPINPRVYREREYSVRPSGINHYSDNYVSYRVAPESRQISHYEDSSRDYWRSTSAMPGSISYGAPMEYTGRMQSVRPELPIDGPEARREITTHAQREYSVRPIDAISRREIPLETHAQREYSVRPIDAISRREIPLETHAQREYSVRPIDAISRRDIPLETHAQREYSVRPVDAISRREIPLETRYYEEVPARRVVARGASVYYNEPLPRRPIEVGVDDGISYYKEI